MDKKIALFNVDSNGELQSDTSAADNAASMAPNMFLVDNELEARLSFCELDTETGRLNVPDTNNSDLRVTQHRSLSSQRNIKHEILKHRNSWLADVMTVGEYDHVSRYGSSARQHLELHVSRHHLFQHQKDQDQPNLVEYVTYKSLMFCPSRSLSAMITLAEVPPAEDGGFPHEESVDTAINVAMEGVRLARAVLVELPTFQEDRFE